MAGSGARGGEPSEAWLADRSRHGGADQLAVLRGPGRLWLAGKHLVAPHPLAAMAATCSDRIVCLCQRAELQSRYPSYVEWLEDPADERGMWRPIPDLHAPPLEEAISLLAELAGCLDAGQGLLLHCGAGIGRAGTVAAGLLIWRGWGLDEARAAVAAARPMAGPEAGAQSELLQALARG